MATKKTTPKKKSTTKRQKPIAQLSPKTPNPEGLQLLEEFDAVALWTALPRKDRDPQYQWDLAHKLSISPDTISDWRKLPEFWERVDAHRQDWVKEDISDVVAGLIKRAKHGSAQEVKLFLQFANAFTEKVEHSGLSSININYVQPSDPNHPDAKATPGVGDTQE